jgi:hypothetical protein
MGTLKRSVFGIPLALAVVAIAPLAFAQELQSLPPGPLHAVEAARQGSAIDVARQGSAGEAARQGSAIDVGRQGSAGEAARQRSPSQLDAMRFEPEEPELALMIKSGEMPYRNLQRFRYTWYYERGVVALYAPICDGPCATQLVQGAYHVALSKRGGKPVPAGIAVVDGPSTLRASYEDHSGERLFGGITFAAGVTGGIVMTVAGVTHSPTDGPLLAGGIGVFLGGAILGTIFASKTDAAHVTVTPLTLPAVGRRESPIAAFGGAAMPQGASVTVTF